jgi:hypothetical protein
MTNPTKEPEKPEMNFFDKSKDPEDFATFRVSLVVGLQVIRSHRRFYHVSAVIGFWVRTPVPIP